MSFQELDTNFIKQMVEKAIPLHNFLKVELLEFRHGYAKLKVPFREEVIGDIRSRRWHGGIIATMIDSVGGLVGFSYSSSMEDKISTIDLRVDYLRGAKEGALIVDGEVLRNGNRILVTTMRAWLENKDECLAEGRGVYSIYRK